MELWLIWLIAAAALIVIEVCSQALWSLCLAVGSLAAMAAALFGASFAVQLAAFAVGLVAAYLALMPVYRRWLQRQHARSGAQARTGMDALLGRRAVVTHEIRPGYTGRARIDGDNWQVRAPGVGTVIPAGTEVTVTAYDSIILDVAL